MSQSAWREGWWQMLGSSLHKHITAVDARVVAKRRPFGFILKPHCTPSQTFSFFLKARLFIRYENSPPWMSTVRPSCCVGSQGKISHRNFEMDRTLKWGRKKKMKSDIRFILTWGFSKVSGMSGVIGPLLANWLSCQAKEGKAASFSR